jgi:hypothetical protein
MSEFHLEEIPLIVSSVVPEHLLCLSGKGAHRLPVALGLPMRDCRWVISERLPHPSRILRKVGLDIGHQEQIARL